MWLMAVARGNTFVLAQREVPPAPPSAKSESRVARSRTPGRAGISSPAAPRSSIISSHDDVKAVSFVGSTRVAAHHLDCDATAGARPVHGREELYGHHARRKPGRREKVSSIVFKTAASAAGRQRFSPSQGGWASGYPQARGRGRKKRVAEGNTPGVGMGPVIDDASAHGFIASGETDARPK